MLVSSITRAEDEINIKARKLLYDVRKCKQHLERERSTYPTFLFALLHLSAPCITPDSPSLVIW
jgi:hypothetical protein